MTLVSQAEFAKICNKSRKTVTTWKQGGKLILEDGMVNVEATEALMKKYRRGGSPVVTLAEKTVTQRRKGNKKGNTSPLTIMPNERPEEAVIRALVSNGADMTMDEARRVKENYLALLNQLEYEKKYGSLVDFEVAQAVFFEEFRAQRDSWLNWPARIAPFVAMELGVESDRVTEVLTAQIHRQLTQLGVPEANFDDRNSQ